MPSFPGMGYPLVPGYESVGVVTQAGPGSHLREGERVFVPGARCFGENYVAEALAKISVLADLRERIEWHLIGPLQANKTRAVAEHFDWVHSVDRLKIAQRLSEQRPAHLPPLQLCLQVNVSGEASKSGLGVDEVPEVARAVAALSRVRLRGLMAIPAPAADVAAQRAAASDTTGQFGAARQDLNSGLGALATGQNMAAMSSQADLRPATAAISQGIGGLTQAQQMALGSGGADFSGSQTLMQQAAGQLQSSQPNFNYAGQTMQQGLGQGQCGQQKKQKIGGNSQQSGCRI
jgi:pyridoxal phosphate enzyme (YggS family)